MKEKVSQKPDASLPISGTDILYLIQGGSKKITVNNFTGYLKYTCQLFQILTNAPYDNVLANTFGGLITWTRNDIGNYNGFLAGAFPEFRTAFVHASFTNDGLLVVVVRLDNDNIAVSVNTPNQDAADGLNAFDLEIQVYPTNQLND